MTEQPTIVVLPDGRLAYTIPQLAAVVPWSEETLRAAVRKGRDDGQFPPPLRAKRYSAGSSKITVLATEVQRWLERLPDY